MTAEVRLHLSSPDDMEKYARLGAHLRRVDARVLIGGVPMEVTESMLRTDLQPTTAILRLREPTP